MSNVTLSKTSSRGSKATIPVILRERSDRKDPGKFLFWVLTSAYDLLRMTGGRATHSLGITLSLLFLSLLFPLTSNAAKISGGFIVTENHFDFTKSIVSGKCTGRIPYPVLTHDDQELTLQINDEIFDFVELYALCNQGGADNFSVSFDMPPSGVEDYFSVRWITKKDDKIYRIDSLNFNANTDDLLTADDVFNSLSSMLLGELVKLSQGHLPAHFTWEDFLDKIGKRDIQYYIKNKQWFIVFNATPQLDKVVDVKIPEYFLKGDDVTDAR